MGLCKCSKKKVTNLFCFEHKVNVCEHCLVENHEKCIVKSYLQWLEDSDYSTLCAICDKQLQNETMDCVRLVCYDVFHLQCLNTIADNLPDTTAPAGYECPSCTKSIIPQLNQAGPLIDNLKCKLRNSDWFQRSIGVKLVDDGDMDNFEIVEQTPPQRPDQKSNEDNTRSSDLDSEDLTRVTESYTSQTNQNRTLLHIDHSYINDHTVYQMPDVEDQPANIRKSATGNKPQLLPSVNLTHNERRIDADDKYSRRPLLTHLSTLIKAHFPYSTTRRSPQKAYYYFMISLVLGILVFILLLWFFSILGRYTADNDPMLDPRFNPNLIFAKDGIKHGGNDNSIIRGGNIEPPKVR